MPRKAKTVKAEPVQEPEPQNTVVETPEEDASTQPTLAEDFTSLVASLKSLREHLAQVQRDVRDLEKRSARELRAAEKTSRRRKTTNRKPSGFVKPTRISDQLATFLGRPKGAEMARNEVTSEIQKYILKHDLQNPENKRHILPDKALRTLLGMKKSDKLTYFNLQKYMKHHFATATKAAESS